MASFLRIIFITLCLATSAWIGYNVYQYFFDITPPILIIHGIHSENYYAGEIHCVIEGRDDYKIKNLSIKLDETILLNKHSINSSSCDYHITLPTSSLDNGKHILTITAIDSARKANSTSESILFYVDNTPLQCSFLKSTDHFTVNQGDTLHLQFQSNKDISAASVKTLAYEIPCYKESPRSYVYECFIPISTDESPNEYLATIEIQDKVGNNKKLETAFEIKQVLFKTDTISVDQKTDFTSTGKTKEQFKIDIEEISNQSNPQKLWNGTFFAPCNIQRVSTGFGVRRISREYGRYSHEGIDLIATPKGPVWACQDGILVIKDEYEHTGKTVVIDHGCGIISIYGHLDNYILAPVGSSIKKGNIIGWIGKTGYATGYHLHFEMRINNTPVNPMQWIGESMQGNH